MATCLEKINLTLKTYYKYRQFSRRQNNPEQIAMVQNEKLRKLISYCYENIKHYRELFKEHGILPGDIKTSADLVKLPILSKSQLRGRFWDFLPRELPPCKVSRTSGSTGIPVCILSDVNSRMNNSAAVIRYRRQLGIDFVGTPILTPQKNGLETRKKPHWTFLQGIHKTYYVNPYADIKAEVDYSIDILKGLTAPAIIGITPAIRALAWRIRYGILPAIRPCAVLTSGEYLSRQVRELMEDTFETKVSDIYACNEAGDIAWQCKVGQIYHINADNCIVEIVKDGKPAQNNQIGEVVITNLNRYSMPFIRYKNGDMAKFSEEKCSCGCRLPGLSEIAGRTGEDIYLPDGEILPWNQLKGFMNHQDVRQFQLVQNKDASLTIKFVSAEKNNIEQTKHILASRFESVLGDRIKFDFSIVQNIPPAASGKSKLVISNYHQ